MGLHDSTDDWLDVRAVARLFRVTPRTVRRWVAVGKLPSPIRLNARFVRWRRRDLQQYLESLVPPTPTARARPSA